MPASAASTCRARGGARGCSRSTRRRISARTGSRVRCWCRRRPIEGMTFHQRTQVPLAKGKVRHVGEPVVVVVAVTRYVAEDALAGHRGRLRAAAGRGRSRKGARSRRRPGPRGRGLERRRLCAAEEGRLRGGQGASGRDHPPPLLLRPRRRGGRSRTAASSPSGTRGPSSSPSGTPPRRRSPCATASPPCWTSPSTRCGWSRRSSAAASAPRS